MNPYFQKQIKNVPVKRQRPRTSRYNHSWWVYLMIVIGCVISYGFVMAAQSHFSAVSLGYQSEELKRQRAQLELGQRKLSLELERRTAPKRLDDRAQQQGLTLPNLGSTSKPPVAASTAD